MLVFFSNTIFSKISPTRLQPPLPQVFIYVLQWLSLGLLCISYVKLKGHHVIMMNIFMDITTLTDTLSCVGPWKKKKGERTGHKEMDGNGGGASTELNFEPCTPSIQIQPCNQQELKSN